MAGVWEVISISKSFVPLREWETFLNRVGFSYDNIEISSIDDWKYTNETRYPALSDPQMLVESGKIVLINMSGNGIHAGLIINYHQGCYWANLWVNTKEIAALDSDSIDDQNSYYYHAGTEFADNFLIKHGCIAVLMGFELCVEENADIKRLLSQSRNVTLGLLSKSHFQREELMPNHMTESSNYYIYAKLSEP